MTPAEIAAALANAQASLVLIETAMAKGEMSVTFADRSVMYRGMSDLLKAQGYWAGLIARLSGATGTRPKQSLGYASKGL